MNQLIDYNSYEKECLLEVCSQHRLDKWIASVVENYIYSYKEHIFDKNKKRCVSLVRFDEQHGPSKTYLKDKLLIDCNYKNNKLYGEYKYYHTMFTNNLMIHSFFVDDVLHGEYKYYEEDGKLVQHWRYKGGIVDEKYKIA